MRTITTLVATSVLTLVGAQQHVLKKLEVGSEVIELQGACGFRGSSLRCWDMQGRVSSVLTEGVAQGLKGVGAINIGFRRKNRLVLYKQTNLPTVRATPERAYVDAGTDSFWFYEEAVPAPNGTRTSSRYQAVQVQAVPGAKTLTVAATVSRVIQSQPMAFAKGAQTRYEGKVVTIENIAVRTASVGGQTKSYALTLRGLSPRSGMTLLALGKRGDQIQAVDANGVPCLPGSGSFMPIGFVSSATSALVEVTLNVNPVYLKGIQLYGSKDRKVVIGGAPADPN